MQPPAKKLVDTPPTVVLVGASVRAAAQSAKRAGFRVLGADLFGDLDTLAACDEFALLDGPSNDELWDLKSLECQANGAPMLLVGGLESSRLPRNAAWLGPNRSTLAEIQNPELLRPIAREFGLDVPQTLLMSDHPPRPEAGRPSQREGEECNSVCEGDNVRWLRKRHGSSGGSGVSWDDPIATRARRTTSLSSQETELRQRWVPGRAFGVTFFATATETHLLGVFRSRFVSRGMNPFLYAGSLGPIIQAGENDLRVHPQANHAPLAPLRGEGRGFLCGAGDEWRDLAPRLVQLGIKLAAKFGLRGLFNFDLIVDRAGMGWVLEVNPRWTAASELVERSLISSGSLQDGDSLLRWHLRALQASPAFSLPRPELDDPQPVWVKRVIYASQAGRIDLSRLATIPHHRRVEFADLPPASRLHRRGDPVLTVIARVAAAGYRSDGWNRNADWLSPRELRVTIAALGRLIQSST